MPRTMDGIFQMLRTLVAGEDMELMVEHPPPQQNDETQAISLRNGAPYREPQQRYRVG